MKILSVVGARPNFMKIAPLVSEFLRVGNIEHLLVHSGQHYDDQLSGSFFRDLDLPRPDVNLQVGSGSHARQTAEVMERLEPVLLEFKPRVVIVVGDVNSTLGAAITAAKLNLPLAHVEAGLRSFDRAMPEEINRKLTDTLADFLFVTEERGMENLRREGIPGERMFLVGNVMIDSLFRYRSAAARSAILGQLHLGRNGSVREYALLTLHRPSNVDDAETLTAVLQAAATIGRDVPVIFPVHPRTRERIERFGCGSYFNSSQGREPAGLVPVDPLGYLDFLCLMDHARLVLTDSGGIQEETTALGIPCLTLRENTERPITIEQGTNQLVGRAPARVIDAARSILQGEKVKSTRPALWDGETAPRIVKILTEHVSV